MLIGVDILVALALFTAVFTFLMLRRGNTRVSKRLENIRKDKNANTVPEPVAENLPFMGRLVGWFGYLLPGQIRSDVVKWDLAQAGYRALGAPRVFAGSRVLTTVGFGLAAMTITKLLVRPQSEVVMVTVVAVAVGYMVPVGFLRWREAKRREEITLALPDALDLMVMCVGAGLGLNAALKSKGYKHEQIQVHRGGIYVKAEKRVPIYEFDYNEFF